MSSTGRGIASPISSTPSFANSRRGSTATASPSTRRADVMVEADRALLLLAVRQLLDNALKYSPPTSTIAIRVARGDDGAVAIAVRNTGSTIAERDRERIFERFYRGPDAVQVPGTGMGLAIVKQIVHAHGGALSVSSTDGHGTEITLSLPTRSGGVNARILVVDDDPQIRRVMRVTLTTQGYEVVDAKTGDEALEQLRHGRTDLVLLDMNMPGMSGLECCRLIRAQSEIAIIMLTVRDSETDKVAALDAGADDYVTKPFNTPELLARIRAALRRMPTHTRSQPNHDRTGGSRFRSPAGRSPRDAACG